MNALPATKIGTVRNRKVSARKLKAKKQAKLSLIVNRTSRQEDALTAQEREDLVVKCRLKARKLGRSILRKWHSRLDLQEVDSIVDLSLCEAVKRYNPNKGASFMTFLFYHLRGNLIRAVSAAASANVVPSIDSLAQWNGADSNYDEPQQESNDLVSIRGVSANEIAEALCSQDFLSPDEALFKKEVDHISEQACAKLDPLEREVIERIYMQEQQLMDIARQLGYSRCHISRVKKKALETLQSDLSNSLGIQGRGEALEDEDFKSSVSSRRKIQRRRPRGRKLVRVLQGGKSGGHGAVA